MKNILLTLLTGAILIFAACRETYTPKPEGYMKIQYPQKNYILFDTNAPFRFEVPSYAEIIPDDSPNAEDFWYNIYFPDFDATIYLSYKEVNNNLQVFVEDSRSLVYKHTIKADAIDETPVRKPGNNVYGIIYDLKGNTASSMQFFLTDSTSNFLRGSLYFNTTPNSDSLAPVISFIRKDAIRLIESFEWK